MSMFLEDIPLDQEIHLGSYQFTEKNIKSFAEKYDPQRFHLSTEAAADTHFGALCASGWHTVSAWMRAMVKYTTKLHIEKIKSGANPARVGPSPGFDDLRWLKPVFVGDTIDYYTAPFETRPSRSKPEWGILRAHNEGRNQNGDVVLRFTSTVFLERKNKGTGSN